MTENDYEIESQEFRIPKWLKYFSFFFIVTGFAISIVIVLNIFGFQTPLRIYGLNSNTILNWPGVLIGIVYGIKFLVSYGVLKRRKWSFGLAIFDAILGIVICISNFGITDILTNKSNIDFELRLEIFLLIPYLIYMIKSKSEWEKSYQLNLKLNNSNFERNA